MAESFQATKEAFYGSIDNSGRFLCVYNDLLERAGFNTSAAQPINDKQYTIGSEGKMPYRVLSVSATLSEEQLVALSAVADGDTTLVAVPFEVIPTLDDAKASLAAALLS
ncbi:hypothetical protein STCU_00837 [Strigomonas culicis]|uniref:Uncharacterized protein n=1 Tax=Strigomonas culicis TaxID=28005 RepID=S9W9H5_9TRYP|nr:hypothetical protein STCU_00837 [Strigomonas culicis]|eukprot:EPY35936.1 hypothetical protein STCU_00837 [Strigomonas culicis]